ncbi:Importin subunit alpha-1 [Cardamine amara subsp. amara]|uniref:Importin subunit alpha n=1 Tax=Cardamine amara subsp. amara TaxID=228776 RepID=A0ABD1AB66_CARAN
MSLEPNAKKARKATDSVEKEMDMDEASEMMKGFWSDESSSQLKSTSKFLTFLSSNAPPSIVDVLIRTGIVRRFVNFLKKEDDSMLQNEAACVLSKIAYKNPKAIIEDQAVPILVRFASSINGDDDLREEATLALGHVAYDSLESRNHVLSCGALLPLLAQLNEDTKLSMLRMATWTLSNLCRGQPPLLFDQVKLVVAELVEKVLHLEDKEVLANACWAFYYLSYDSEDGIQSLVDADLVPRLVGFLQHTSPSVFGAALCVIGNIATGDNQQTQSVIDSGVLPILANMLTQDYDKGVEKDACWTVSNIIAGTEEQIQSVIDANLIPTLVNLTQNDKFDIKKDALWAISKAASGGSDDQIKYLVEKNCIKPLCDFLVCEDPEIISLCLDGLENILMAGEVEKNNTGDQVNCYSKLIDDAQGQKMIEKLQSHEDNEIYEKALKILETYWPEEEDEETQQPPM